MRLTCNNIIYKVHNYNPFGGVMDEGARRGADVQNHLYNGKELDRMHGLNLYDYSARLYDPAIGQFTSIDPLCEKYYHISPYAYCAGNPVKYVDPDGRNIKVNGDEEFRWWVLRTLQQLTNDKLSLSKNGYIYIAKDGKGQANSDQDLSVGTELLRETIGNRHTAFVSLGEKNNTEAILVGEKPDPAFGYSKKTYDNENDPYNGKGTNVRITLIRGTKSGLLVSSRADGKGSSETEEFRPEYIGVGHEFIHGLRKMMGEAVPMTSTGYDYIDVKGRSQHQQEGLEEFHTVGLMGNYRYTENKIRNEHGLRWRRSY